MIIPHAKLEQSLWKKGFLFVAGVDEAGRGPLAGPITAGAVMIQDDKQVVTHVRDSKLMSETQREKAFVEICKQSTAYGIGIVEAREIDTIGISNANKKVMMIALQQLEKNFDIALDYVLVDGSKTPRLDRYLSQRILKGGLYHYSISAGSILAKVTRDRIMKQFAKQYPEYGFEKHVGYGTKAHMLALKKYGPCEIHRTSYTPIKKFLIK